MVYIRIHRLTTGSVSNGASKEDTWKADAKYTLKRVTITPRGNSVLTNVQFYADVNGVPFFRPDIPAEILDPVNTIQPEYNIPLVAGDSFNYKLTNNSGASETYDICLWLETEAWPPAR